MPNKEKAIRGLECCMRENNTNMCGDCPYHDSSETRFGCMQSAMRDTLALLKEQEPRVLDADEVLVTELSTVLYLERRRARETTRIVPAILMDHDTRSYGLLSSYRYAEFVHEGKLIDHRDMAAYGVTWRCWTAYPSKEQRAAVPWEEKKNE